MKNKELYLITGGTSGIGKGVVLKLNQLGHFVIVVGRSNDKLELITSSSPLEIGTLLKRMTGVTLFGVAAEIAKTWDLETQKWDIIKNSECIKCKNSISALTHFLFFYLVSKPAFMDLNSLIEFNPECMKLIPKTTQRIMDAD
jgi:hypothetical protein